MGMIKEWAHVLGKDPEIQQEFIKSSKTWREESDICFRNSFGIKSGPMAFPVDKEVIVWCRSLCENGMERSEEGKCKAISMVSMSPCVCGKANGRSWFWPKNL